MTSEKSNISRLYLIVDLGMALFLLLSVGAGLILKFVFILTPAKATIFGTLANSRLLGMTKHNWGQIHFAFTLAFISILLLHIILHWKTAVTLFKKSFTSLLGRTIIIGVFIILFLVLIVGPFLIAPRQKSLQPHFRNHFSNSASESNNDPFGILIDNNANKLLINTNNIY